MVQPAVPVEEGKKEFVHKMFDKIAPRYDLLNRVLSGGIDQSWRRKTVSMLAADRPKRILDIATGTADLAIMTAKLKPVSIIGVDIAEEMLEIGRRKIRRKGLDDTIELRVGDAEDLPFQDAEFDAVLVAFGVRNFENLGLGLSEMGRVLKPGGRLLILEFSRPTVVPIKQLYSFYGRYILPRIGKIVSGDDEAYSYLPESIEGFPEREDFLELMDRVGFADSTVTSLTFGIAAIYSARAGQSGRD